MTDTDTKEVLSVDDKGFYARYARELADAGKETEQHPTDARNDALKLYDDEVRARYTKEDGDFGAYQQAALELFKSEWPVA